ncbi:MAG: uroporphyrinogen-III synthase [Patescibacteria group bacterium]
MSNTLTIQGRVTRLPLSRASSQALAHIERYDWILFTSKHAVVFFAKDMRRRRLSLSQKSHVAAVGPETAAVLRAEGFPVHIVPKRFTARDMVNDIPNVKGLRILFPRSAIAPPDAIRILRKRGARVTVVPLYITTVRPLSRAEKRALLAGSYTRLIFRSPSGVRGLMRQLQSKKKHVVRTISVQCIGPTTKRAAREAGFKHITITGAR